MGKPCCLLSLRATVASPRLLCCSDRRSSAECFILAQLTLTSRHQTLTCLFSFLCDSAVSVHGDKSQEERNESIRHFKDGSKDVLVATDVAAKGGCRCGAAVRLRRCTPPAVCYMPRRTWIGDDVHASSCSIIYITCDSQASTSPTSSTSSTSTCQRRLRHTCTGSVVQVSLLYSFGWLVVTGAGCRNTE